MPEVPTIAEAGVPGYEAIVWIGVLAPAGTSHRQAERRDREAGAHRRGEEAPRPDRHGARPGHARAVRRLRQGRLRQMGEGRPRFRGDGELASVECSGPVSAREITVVR